MFEEKKLSLPQKLMVLVLILTILSGCVLAVADSNSWTPMSGSIRLVGNKTGAFVVAPNGKPIYVGKGVTCQALGKETHWYATYYGGGQTWSTGAVATDDWTTIDLAAMRLDDVQRLKALYPDYDWADLDLALLAGLLTADTYRIGDNDQFAVALAPRSQCVRLASFKTADGAIGGWWYHQATGTVCFAHDYQAKADDPDPTPTPTPWDETEYNWEPDDPDPTPTPTPVVFNWADLSQDFNPVDKSTSTPTATPTPKATPTPTPTPSSSVWDSTHYNWTDD